MKPIRITEVGTMGVCEKKWHYRYVLEQEDPSSPAMSKGTLLHGMYAAWWKHGQPETMVGFDFDLVLAEVNPDHLPDVQKMKAQDLDDALWIFERFCLVNGGLDHFELVGSEIELEAEVDGLLLQGKADAIVRNIRTNDLFLAECKSMRDWRRLDILEVDPQMTHYYLLCQAAGYPVKGIMYDALKTYRWKRDEHPPEDSIRRLFINRTAEQCEASLDDLHAFADRREDLTDLPRRRRKPLRNISSFGSCSFCSFRPQCWEELAFPETEFDLVDE